jgi:hypothetical protein
MVTRSIARPVVVEVDGTAEGLRVVDYACAEAMRSGSELILARLYREHGPDASDLPPAEQADSDLRIATAHARRQAGPSLPMTAVSVRGTRLRELPRIARNARLLIVGRSRARGPQRLISAQGNLFLAARTACPVVVVPASWKPSSADRTVAVGIDGTALSTEAVEFAFRTAAEREGNLVVVHAEHVPRQVAADRSFEESWVRTADLTVAEALAGWSARYPEVRITRYLTGRPAVAALVRESQQAGLVVIGAHAGALPIGDPVARRTVAAITCPVAIVPHRLTEAERVSVQRRAQRPAGVVVPTY